jgi:hypothetical protein
VCDSPPICQTGGACDPTSGICSYANALDGTSCTSGGLCGTCMTGACSNLAACDASDEGG